MESNRIYDRLDLIVSCSSDAHWEDPQAKWAENDFGRRPDFDVEDHLTRRDAAQVRYERQFWFDITDVFERAHDSR